MHSPKTWSLICIGQLLLSMRSALGLWLMYPVSFHWRNWLAFPQNLSIRNNVLVRGGTPCLLPILLAGILFSLSLCSSPTAVRHWRGILRRLLKRTEKEKEVGILMAIIIHDTWENNFKKKIKWTKTSCMTLKMQLKARHKGKAVNSTFKMVKESKRRQKFIYCENILQNWLSNKAMFCWKTKLSHHKNC